ESTRRASTEASPESPPDPSSRRLPQLLQGGSDGLPATPPRVLDHGMDAVLEIPGQPAPEPQPPPAAPPGHPGQPDSPPVQDPEPPDAPDSPPPPDQPDVIDPQPQPESPTPQ